MLGNTDLPRTIIPKCHPLAATYRWFAGVMTAVAEPGVARELAIPSTFSLGGYPGQSRADRSGSDWTFGSVGITGSAATSASPEVPGVSS